MQWEIPHHTCLLYFSPRTHSAHLLFISLHSAHGEPLADFAYGFPLPWVCACSSGDRGFHCSFAFIFQQSAQCPEHHLNLIRLLDIGYRMSIFKYDWWGLYILYVVRSWVFVLTMIFSTEHLAHIFNYLFHTMCCKISGIFVNIRPRSFISL